MFQKAEKEQKWSRADYIDFIQICSIFSYLDPDLTQNH
jgi:hypothetical protein